jgi:hypothetical protein
VSANKRRGTWRPPYPDWGVQTRVVIDAIVSNKTFANATVQQLEIDFVFLELSKPSLGGRGFRDFQKIQPSTRGHTSTRKKAPRLQDDFLCRNFILLMYEALTRIHFFFAPTLSHPDSVVVS